LPFIPFQKLDLRNQSRPNYFLLADVPKLAPIPVETEFEEFHEEPAEKKPRTGRPSGPKTPDPYAIDDSSIMLPVLVAIGAFIPLLFCLCKL